MNVNSILDKFDNITIENDTRISADDREFCEGQQIVFDKALKVYEEISPKFQELYKIEKEYKSIYPDSDGNCLTYSKTFDTEEAIEMLKISFASQLFSYFRKKYNISIDSSEMPNRENIKSYNEIVDNIFFQLGGYNFQDKAEKEIKDNMAEKCKSYWGNQRVKLNKVKITIDNFFWIDSFNKKYGDYEISYNSDENFYALFKAFSYFMFKSTECYYNNLYNTITRGKNDAVFTTHSIANNGILTLKLFKNGKIEIVFSSTEYAREFAKEYCGYIPEQQVS